MKCLCSDYYDRNSYCKTFVHWMDFCIESVMSVRGDDIVFDVSEAMKWLKHFHFRKEGTQYNKQQKVITFCVVLPLNSFYFYFFSFSFSFSQIDNTIRNMYTISFVRWVSMGIVCLVYSMAINWSDTFLWHSLIVRYYIFDMNVDGQMVILLLDTCDLCYTYV